MLANINNNLRPTAIFVRVMIIIPVGMGIALCATDFLTGSFLIAAEVATLFGVTFAIIWIFIMLALLIFIWLPSSIIKANLDANERKKC